MFAIMPRNLQYNILSLIGNNQIRYVGMTSILKFSMGNYSKHGSVHSP